MDEERAQAGITDCHVHLLPGRLGEAVRAFFEEHITGTLAYPNDHRVVLDALAASGVDRAWHLPYAHKPGVADGLNRASAELVETHRGHSVTLVGGATVHPGDDRPETLLRAAIDDHGLRVLKMHCSVGDHDVDDPRLDAVWRLVERRSVPAVVHAGRHVSGTTAADDLTGVDRVARRFPGAPIVIAHAGHPATARALELVAAHDNVYVDLTPRVSDLVAISDEDVERHRDRVLFGSDAPNTEVPLGQALARLDGLSRATRDAVLHGNADRLLASVT